MKFTPGEVIVIANPSTLYTSQFQGYRAVVTDYKENEIFPYEVTFANGTSMGFAEEELSSAELTDYLEVIDELTAAMTADAQDQEHDEVNHPSHYTWLPNGLEVIDVTEHFNFTLGNALKYIMRAGHKHDEPITDLRKAVWYINREIERLENA
ncbi:DUF3310 domain-containing protein [Streptomyces sp. NPDC058274]|uniref:DUF3310 domain-containing protein n=1 Tax=Streptomyces sp. NPDC058274 TaxID=3346416 RepID=UPI0036E85C92